MENRIQRQGYYGINLSPLTKRPKLHPFEVPNNDEDDDSSPMPPPESPPPKIAHNVSKYPNPRKHLLPRETFQTQLWKCKKILNFHPYLLYLPLKTYLMETLNHLRK